MGRISNISTQGVSVEYAEGAWQPQAGQEVGVKLAIDLQCPLMVEDASCVTIYDIPTLAHDETFRGSRMRLCGLKYSNLSDVQRNQLRRLLDSIR